MKLREILALLIHAILFNGNKVNTRC